MPGNAEERPLYDVLAEVFRREGTDTCFALQGDANMCFATRLSDRGCRTIHVRHEHCAVSAATSYARKTGDVGVATVTCGPGLSQIMTALTTAVHIRVPLVVFAGEAPLRRAWYNQKIDQGPYVTATGAAYHQLHWGPLMPTAVRDAFLQARRERRPVVIGVPSDIQEDIWTPEPLPVPSTELLPSVAPIAPNDDDVARAAGLVANAERVVIVAGLGAAESGAGPACRQLAERIDGLVGTTLPNRGFFHDDPFSLGIVGGLATDPARALLAEADLILAVGCSLKHHNTMGGSLYPKAKVLQIDVDPISSNQGDVIARHHMRADARLGVEALLAAVPARPLKQRNPETARALAEPPPQGDGEIEPGLYDPRSVVAALQSAIPTDWEFVNTSGHVSSFTAHMPSRPANRFLTVREFGTIGNGTSFATGVAAASPDTPIVLLDGDGSLLMHVQELETISRHKLKILVVALNDGAYSAETHKLRARGLSIEGALFGRTDFAAVARAFGLGGHTVNDLADIPRLLEEFRNSDVGAVWDIPISDLVVSGIMKGLTGKVRRLQIEPELT